MKSFTSQNVWTALQWAASLGALTAETPKPLLEVAGVSFLDHVIRHLVDRGVDRVLLLAGFEALQVVAL